ncbi:Dna2/Cas4 domain-containing protein [Thermoplasmatales archaeon AK]|nr:Dna2/Cas4 domain-containing protein [Thermoplasmatales archaeon AK]
MSLVLFLGILVIALVLLSVLFHLLSRMKIYTDLHGQGEILRSERLGISGKPDMIVRRGREIIPYEYKSTDSDKPREGHIMQMAAYFAILEENFPDNTVNYGVLKYKDTAFRIENTQELRLRLIETVNEMRSLSGMPERNHEKSGRCFRCSFSNSCEQRLIKIQR